MKRLLTILLLLSATGALASGEGMALRTADIQWQDKAAIKRGAKLFVTHCLNCHSANLMRYSRIGEDLGMTETEVMDELITTSAKPGDIMAIAMQPDDAKRWFGVAPPDLSVIARARGTDWLYNYLHSFYLDAERPWGVNNALFKDVAMPHVLAELQGLQEAQWQTVTTAEGQQRQVISGMKLVQPGKLSVEDYDRVVLDLVTFLAYMGEPSKLSRIALAPWVLGYLLVLLVLVYLLKRNYWKAIH